MGCQGWHPCSETEWRAGLPGLGHARRAEPQAIDEQYVAAAVLLWRDYFWLHSRAALRQIGLTEKHTNFRRVLCWIQTNRKLEVSLLDIRREALGRRVDAEQT